MKIKKNTFSTLVLELFFPSIANCKKLKIQKIQKSTSPIAQPLQFSINTQQYTSANTMLYSKQYTLFQDKQLRVLVDHIFKSKQRDQCDVSGY
jgi:hypothetical protein